MTVRRLILRGLGLILALLLVFVAGALVMHFGMHRGQHQQILDLQARVDTLRMTEAETNARLAGLQGQLDVELATRRTLEDTLARQQQELGRTRDQLAFYEQLIPPGPAGAVAIRAFDIRRQGDFLHYRVLLTRNAPGQEAFRGRMRFMADALKDGNPVKIELSAATAVAAPPSEIAAPGVGADPFSLVFEQFQRSTGVLRLPPGVAIRSVNLEVLEDGVIRATRDATIVDAAPEGSAPGVTP
ncbi:DUF6776 family protein [Castellaniella sp. GW247-6E4]|uniref:DUF6776 family protein n=1 Tax=Castellaniella sp. GW247-6E4 TaxID=3140380 RepID=UPI003314C53F